MYFSVFVFPITDQTPFLKSRHCDGVEDCAFAEDCFSTEGCDKSDEQNCDITNTCPTALRLQSTDPAESNNIWLGTYYFTDAVNGKPYWKQNLDRRRFYAPRDFCTKFNKI